MNPHANEHLLEPYSPPGPTLELLLEEEADRLALASGIGTIALQIHGPLSKRAQPFVDRLERGRAQDTKHIGHDLAMAIARGEVPESDAEMLVERVKAWQAARLGTWTPSDILAQLPPDPYDDRQMRAANDNIHSL